MRRTEAWALLLKTEEYTDTLGIYCWRDEPRPVIQGGVTTALFKTRKVAREAAKTCCYHNYKPKPTPIKVVVTITPTTEEDQDGT